MKRELENWYRLEKELSNYLYSFASERLQFRKPNQSIIGFPTDGFRSDGMLTDGNILLAIEVEAGQMHPDTNVGKYWFLFEGFKRYSKIILFHIYTPAFDSYEWRMKLASFYAEKMKKDIPFQYQLFDYRKSIDIEKTSEEVKLNIELTIKDNFNDLS